MEMACLAVVADLGPALISPVRIFPPLSAAFSNFAFHLPFSE
jgi:hypothetical protein